MEKVIKGYKGFNKDMTCRGLQYEEGKEYEEETANACHSGFHACEYPLDCFNYYSPNESVYHEVEQSSEFDRGKDDSKVASTKIKIGARLDISGLVKAAIDFTMSRVKKEAGSNEDYGAFNMVDTNSDVDKSPEVRFSITTQNEIGRLGSSLNPTSSEFSEAPLSTCAVPLFTPTGYPIELYRS